MDGRAMDRSARLPVQFQPLVLLDPNVSCPMYRDIIAAAAAAAAAGGAGAGGAAQPPADVEQLHQLQRELGRLAASVNEHARILDGELATLDALIAENIPPGVYEFGSGATSSPTAGGAGSDAGFHDYFDYTPEASSDAHGACARAHAHERE